MRARMTIGSLVLGLVLAALSAGPGPALAPSAAPEPRAQLSWHACGDGFACARYAVPLDYAAPDGRHLSLALIKLPAAEQAHRIGTLFVNPGGPGESGVGFVRHEAAALPQQIRDRFDVVGFDPRGVGRSSPIHCFASAPESNRFWADVPLFPVTAEQRRAAIAASKAFAKRCIDADPMLLAHLSTTDVARDLDRLRVAVGDRRLTFIGYSYGSMVGLTYANLFPNRVRAISVDGVIDPVSWIGRGPTGDTVPVDARLKSDLGANAALRGFLNACQSHPGRCVFAAADTRAKFDRLMHIIKVRAVASGDLVDEYQLTINDVLHGLYGFSPASRLARELQALWEHRHDKALAIPRRPGLEPRRSTGYFNGLDSSYAVTCADADNPDDPAAWVHYGRVRSEVSPYFGAYWTWLDLPCATWLPPSPDRFIGRFDATTSTPVLFVSNFRDPATRHQDAVDAAARMPGSRLLTIDGTGHTSLTQDSSCARRAITRYIVAQRLPRDGLVCSVDGGLFGS